MRKIIHNLRQQPEEVRRHILHILTVICGVVLLVFWVYSLGSNIINSEMQAKIEEDLEPFSALKGNIIGGYQSIINSDLNLPE